MTEFCKPPGICATRCVIKGKCFPFALDKVCRGCYDKPKKRTIFAQGKEKQTLVKGVHGRAVGNEELFKRLVDIVERDLENASYDEGKFENVLILTKLREFISEQKKKHRIE